MVEKVLERDREPEPRETIYDQLRRIDNERIMTRLEGKVVVKGREIPYEQNRQGLAKSYTWDKNWNRLGVPGEHQHYNEDPEKASEWMAFIFTPLRDPTGVEFLQCEDHVDWAGTKSR